MSFYEIDGVVPVVGEGSFVHDTASIIGDVIIGENCYIGPHASLRADFGRIIVGDGSNVQDSVVIHAFPGADTVLAPNSHVGHSAVLHGCRVGSFALIGIGAIVLDDAEIGEGALVGAGALVTAGTRIAPRMMALGSPAREIKELDETALAWKERGVHVYQELTTRSLATLRPVEPLTEVQTDRPRVSTDASVSVPLHQRKVHGPGESERSESQS